MGAHAGAPVRFEVVHDKEGHHQSFGVRYFPYGSDRERAAGVTPSVSTVRPAVASQARFFAGRLAFCAAGVAVFALGNTLLLQGNVGLGAWNVFHYGITLVSPLSYGQATILFSVLMMFASWRLGIAPGVGTIVNGIGTGIFVDLYLASGLIPKAETPLLGYPVFLAGLFLFGLGTALYIKPALGAGPRDSFMLGMIRRTGWRVDVVRTSMEAGVLVLGVLLGGPVGGGTVIFTLTIGPIVRFWFRVFGIAVPRRETPALGPKELGTG